MKRTTIWLAAIALAAPAAAQGLQERVEQVLERAGPGVRFGLVVADDNGGELIAINPEQRFIPASNTKMITTAAVFATLSGLDRPDEVGGAAIRLETHGDGPPDVVLEGHGDARLSSAPACKADCLATLADAVAAAARQVRHVFGDDTLFPDERWSPGMSWNNIPTESGTATSALTLDDNELAMTVAPTRAGRPPQVTLPPYYSLDNRATTVAGSAVKLGMDREPNRFVIRLTGTIGAGAGPERIRLGIDDPAHYAAWRLRELLEARGVAVSGTVGARHRILLPDDDPAQRGPAPAAAPAFPTPLARLTPPPLAEDLTLTNKVSQNLHAELLLRRLGRANGSGSIADGQAVVQAMLAQAGLPRASFDFHDGGGMSTYNRITPRAMVTLLRWAATQPWGAAWRATFPVGGGQGLRRMNGTFLDGRVNAKTGTLNATNALSGYLTARSGRTLTFALYANDVPDDANAIPAMDAALALIAAEN